MRIRTFSIFIATTGLVMALVDIRSTPILPLREIDMAMPSAVAGEIAPIPSSPVESLDTMNGCGLDSRRLAPLDVSVREQICSELTLIHERLQRMQLYISSFRKLIVASENRYHQMQRLAADSTDRVRELSQKLLMLERERDQLKYLLKDFNLSATN
jgi:hypothetical protein